MKSASGKLGALPPPRAGERMMWHRHRPSHWRWLVRANACAVLFAALLLSGIATAEENFYAGRQIAWILSADAGGGFAARGRAGPRNLGSLQGSKNLANERSMLLASRENS